MVNTEDFIKRLEIILDYYSLNASSFADKIGVQRSNISHILSGRSKPSFDFLEKIINHFPRVNATWLITGNTKESEPVNNEMHETLKTNTQAHKTVVKLVEFYTDNTFKTFFPTSE